MKRCLLPIALAFFSMFGQQSHACTDQRFAVYTQEAGVIDCHDPRYASVTGFIFDQHLFKMAIAFARHNAAGNIMVKSAANWTPGSTVIVSTSSDNITFEVVQASLVTIETLNADGSISYTALNPYEYNDTQSGYPKIALINDQIPEFLKQLLQAAGLEKSAVLLGTSSCGNRHGCEGGGEDGDP